jgi:hypothetical protein
MIASFEAAIQQVSIHRVGNKLLDEFYVLSDTTIATNDDVLNGLMMKYFLSPFEKVNEVYRFMHSSDDLNLNGLFHFCEIIFNDQNTFHQTSQQITKYLFDTTNHPKIKSGELYIAYFNNIQLEGELLSAVGIFKSETKEPYLKVYPDTGGFNIEYEQDGINLNKLDKGCLVFNSEKEEGYKVLVIDQTNRNNEAVYWKDDFLKLRIRNDSFNQTSNTMSIYKNFVSQKLDDEFDLTKADKIDLLNKSMKYFKDNDTFDLDEFGNEVLGNPKAIESFKTYKNQYEQDHETEIATSFDISSAAVKKQGRVYKSILKLDRNFHIYIHGNKDLIEKGFDDDKAMNYYKVYFKEEA